MKKYSISILFFLLVLIIIGCDETVTNSNINPGDTSGSNFKISFIIPSSGRIGDTITISGIGFGNTQGTSYISFNGQKTTNYLNWSKNLILLKIPNGATSGKVSVTVNSKKSNEVDFTVLSGADSIAMVSISAGTFQMGSTGGIPGGESPVHTVKISKDFLISKYEITQKLYNEVMVTNPSGFKGDNLPVESINWYDAIEFCNKLSDIEGLEKCYTINGTNVQCNWNANGYRLPTEAEWEYACKAGTTTDFYSGNLVNGACTPLDINMDSIGWYCGNSGNQTNEVGKKEPNAFGLFDMSGNVWEWCWDWFGSYPNSTVTDPKGPASGVYHILRGGSWNFDAYNCRSARRDGYTPSDSRDNDNGFRVVRTF